MNPRRVYRSALLVLLVVTVVSHPVAVQAGISVSFHGIHMDPAGQDAKDFSRASFGGGVHASFSIPQFGDLVAGGLGFEFVNMLSENHDFQDLETGLRVQQQTRQNYYRLYLGPEIGPNGPGFFRPHLGAHVAVVNYDISTDVVVPNDNDRENEIRQSLRSESRTVFGYDLNAGTDLNFGAWFVEGGARFAKSFNVPQQLGAGAVTIHPGYVQI